MERIELAVDPRLDLGRWPWAILLLVSGLVLMVVTGPGMRPTGEEALQSGFPRTGARSCRLIFGEIGGKPWWLMDELGAGDKCPVSSV